MAANFKHRGGQLRIDSASAAVTAGALEAVGSAVGVVSEDAAIGESYSVFLSGQWEVRKANTEAWTVGAKLYLNSGEAVLTGPAEGFIGVAAKAASSAANVGEVILGAGGGA